MRNLCFLRFIQKLYSKVILSPAAKKYKPKQFLSWRDDYILIKRHCMHRVEIYNADLPLFSSKKVEAKSIFILTVWTRPKRLCHATLRTMAAYLKSPRNATLTMGRYNDETLIESNSKTNS